MSDATVIVRQRQLAIRRELDRRSIPLKQVSFDSGVPYATLLTYFPVEGSREPAMMPVCALYSLVGAVPADLLSLLLPPGHAILRVPEELDHDECTHRVQEYLTEKAKAHRPDSPAGREISECEDSVLRLKFAAVKAA